MAADLSGQTLGRYVLNRVLGRGGMGEVYEALDPETGRSVAIKVLPASLSAQPGYLDRFNQELKLAASLEHIHILPIYDHGNENGMTYIVMRYLTGSDLQNRIYKLGRPSVQESRKLLLQIGDALDYAHSRGVVHRDLKPNNIMFDERGNAYLGDFGIAKVIGTSAGLTATGQIIGTPYYMAPEQVKGEEVDARADIYSLGIIAFQLLTGELPFNAPTPYALMYKHLSDPPPNVSDIRENLGTYVDAVLLRALAKEPDARYQTAHAFVEELDVSLRDIAEVEEETGFMTVQVDTTNAARAYSQQRVLRDARARRGLPVIWMAGLLALIVAVVAGVLLLGDDDEDPSPTATNDVVAQVSETPAITDTFTSTDAPTLSETEQEQTVESDMALVLEQQTGTADSVLTQTATLWTVTATFDSVATVNARLAVTNTQLALIAQTATATLWTATPTNTLTDTPTELPTDTPPPTLTYTPTDTFTPTPSDTHTPTPTLSPFEKAAAGVTANAEWEPFVQEFDDGIEMVLVPAGCFMMGSETGEADEIPVLEYCIEEPFWIDRYEVTQGDFATLGGTKVNASQFPGDDRPVENVTWLEANSFCEMRGARLPSEVEWEYAARGPDALVFAWGNEFVDANAGYGGNSADQTSPVGGHPGNVSWVGAFDMTSNVWEWANSIYLNYPYEAEGRENTTDTTNPRVLRGGGWDVANAVDLRASYRFGRTPDHFWRTIGFRCARSVE